MADAKAPATKFNAENSSFEHRTELAEKFLSNMAVHAGGLGKTSILLAGDPGVGKTSFMKFLGKLLGIELITIEAPHVTEEHIINIPFIVVNTSTGQEKHLDQEAKLEGEDADYKVVMSDSALYTQLQRAKKLADKPYLEGLYKGDPVMIKVFEELGGTRDTIPKQIKTARDQYECILFLDEYFRQTSPRIRNMLRTILNGKLGTHDLPENVYVAYASNIHDEGVEGVPLNNDFLTVNMKASPKQEWFAWLMAKFKDDKEVKLNEKVMADFYDLLKDEDLNTKDIEADVRVSPRRWEQLLLYINAAIPVKNEHDAKKLISNVKLSFRNYMTGSHAKIADKVVDATVKLIGKTSQISITHDVHGSSDWRKTLEHQIEMKKKLGSARTYIPIIAGLPGIGKTSEVYKMGIDLNLAVVYIDVSTLSAEDVSGIPVPKTNEDKSKIETKFSLPKLFKYIKTKMVEAEKMHVDALKKSGAAGWEAKAEEYKKSKWKYLLFFDELNRNNANVFNGIRRLILEKNLGDNLKLPEGTIMIAALNPEDTGAEKLTQHMVDVSDIIDSAPSWKGTKEHIQGIKVGTLDHPEVKDFVYDMMLAFVDHFMHKKGEVPKGADREFFINAGGDSPLYISPREFTNLYVNAIKYVDGKVTRLHKRRAGVTHPTREEITRDVTQLKHALCSTFEDTFTNIMIKHGVDAPEFLHAMKVWFENETAVDVESLFFSKRAGTKAFAEIMAPHVPSNGPHLADDMEFINYINNSDPQTLKDDLHTFFEKEITDFEEHIIKQQHAKKVLDKDKVTSLEKELVSKTEHLVRELANAFRLHDFSHEKVEVLENTYKELLKKMQSMAPDTSKLMELLNRSGAIKKFTKGLTK